MNDTIYRQAAIRWVKTECNPYGKPTLDFESGKKVIEHLEQMPSAQPERIRGRWVPITESDCSGYDPVLAGYEDPVVGYVCSVCGDGQEKEVMGVPLWNFCPNCGADMRGEELDETD